MFISTAIAQEVGTAVAAQPSMADAFWTNMGLIGLMFVLFYFLMIRPQQKRLKEQRSLLDTLKKGDTVVTGGGLYGTVSKLLSDTEVELDLGGAKVVALRYTIQTRIDDQKDVPLPKATETKKKQPAKPAKKTPVKKSDSTKKTVTKKAVAKKATPKKKTTAKKTAAKKTK